MNYPREVVSNTYPSISFSSNHQMPDDFWVAQGVFPPLGGGGEGYLYPEAGCYPLPNFDISPEDSSDLQVTPPLTHESPSEGWSENESFGEVTPEVPAALSFDVWADGYLRSCFETAAPLDHLSSTSCVNDDSYLFNEQLDENTGEQQGLENVSPECGQTLSTAYLHPQSRQDDFDFDTNHSLPVYFAPGPTSTTCLSHFPTEYFSSPSRHAVAQANVVASYAHSSSHGHPCMAQATVEPNAQQHWGHMPPLYGANPSLTTYAAAAPIREQHMHQQTQNARQPRTLVPQRHHPYPQVRGCSVKASNYVFGPVASSSRLPDSHVFDNPGYSCTASYTLTQLVEPTSEVAGDDNEWYHCQWDGCTDSSPMTYDEVIAHFLEHGKLENGNVKECRWKGCCSKSKFPMKPNGFKRHVRETQKHVGLLKMVRCERCNKKKGLRSIRVHREICSGKLEARAEEDQ